jgi:hypothetical protein
VSLGNSGAEFVNGIDGWVDFSTQSFPGSAERLNYLRKSNIADNQQIYIAALVLFTAGNRAVDKGEADTVGDGCQSILERPSNTGCLCYQALSSLNIGQSRFA